MKSISQAVPLFLVESSKTILYFKYGQIIGAYITCSLYWKQLYILPAIEI